MAKLARGAVLRRLDGATPEVVPGLGDVDWNPGELQYADTTDHATTQFRTSRTPTHRGEATLTAPLWWDGANSVHQKLTADADAVTTQVSFQLRDPTSDGAGKRWEFTGYVSITHGMPVNGIATATLTVSAEPPIDYVDDV